MTEKFTVICRDGEIIEIDKQIASFSGILKDFIGDDNSDSTQGSVDVRRPIFEKMMEFCTHLKDHAPPEVVKTLLTTDLK